MENMLSRKAKDTLGVKELLMESADTETNWRTTQAMTYSDICILFLQDFYQTWHSQQYWEGDVTEMCPHSEKTANFIPILRWCWNSQWGVCVYIYKMDKYWGSMSVWCLPQFLPRVTTKKRSSWWYQVPFLCIVKRKKTTTNFPVSSDRVLTHPYVCTRGEAWIELNTFRSLYYQYVKLLVLDRFIQTLLWHPSLNFNSLTDLNRLWFIFLISKNTVSSQLLLMF